MKRRRREEEEREGENNCRSMMAVNMLLQYKKAQDLRVWKMSLSFPQMLVLCGTRTSALTWEQLGG